MITIIALFIFLYLLTKGAIIEMFLFGLILYVSLLLIVTTCYCIFGKKYKYLPPRKRFWFYFQCICGARREPKNGERVE